MKALGPLCLTGLPGNCEIVHGEVKGHRMGQLLFILLDKGTCTVHVQNNVHVQFYIYT